MKRFSHIHAVPSSVARQKLPHNSIWIVTYLVPGGRAYFAVTDDFGNLREIPQDRAAHSSFAGNA